MTPQALKDFWFEDKANREATIQKFMEKANAKVWSDEVEREILMKMMAEDIRVIRWFVERLISMDTSTPKPSGSLDDNHRFNV